MKEVKKKMRTGATKKKTTFRPLLSAIKFLVSIESQTSHCSDH